MKMLGRFIFSLFHIISFGNWKLEIGKKRFCFCANFVTLYSPEVKLAFGEIKYNHETPKERKHEKLKDKSFSNSISIFSFGL
ncbi:MAG: hypothetical protein V2A53_06730, partial [bacterium]